MVAPTGPQGLEWSSPEAAGRVLAAAGATLRQDVVAALVWLPGRSAASYPD
ncbi:hypothetical protein E2C01_086676 [Portunus trituberculatus]|uniref:Uncharacterized protein n=1 Tax=Portunus trituberculatus TaxID=210409 RepID=A0A5B7JC40_PORTR|nr:hypothetical protein [Portunus trituberculatus]